MIAFRDSLPIIQLANGTCIAFESDWLVRALNVAADRAGHAKWQFAEHITLSIRFWLEDQPTNVIPQTRLVRAVRMTLKAVGYPEIGERFETDAPFARISLLELAQQAGNGFELAFFDALARQLRAVVATGSNYCELHGLEHCVKVLRQRKGWSRSCDKLRAEIVAFARSQSSRPAQQNSDLFLYVA